MLRTELDRTIPQDVWAEIHIFVVAIWNQILESKYGILLLTNLVIHVILEKVPDSLL